MSQVLIQQVMFFCFFFKFYYNLFIFRGQSTREPASSRVTYFRILETAAFFLCFCFSFFYFPLFFLTAVLSYRDFSHRKFGSLSREKPAAKESRYPTDGTCWVFWCFYNPSNSDRGCGILNVRTDVYACDCTRGCTDIVTKVDSRRKLLDAPGNRKIEPAHLP